MMEVWQLKMAQAMDVMQEACEENKDWSKCHLCPFDTFCTALMDAKLIDPHEGINWEYADKTD